MTNIKTFMIYAICFYIVIILIMFILVITACEVAVGLAIFILNQRLNKTIDIGDLKTLKD